MKYCRADYGDDDGTALRDCRLLDNSLKLKHCHGFESIAKIGMAPLYCLCPRFNTSDKMRIKRIVVLLTVAIPAVS